MVEEREALHVAEEVCPEAENELLAGVELQQPAGEPLQLLEERDGDQKGGRHAQQ